MSRKPLALVVVCLCAFALKGCGPREAPPDIKIGVIAELSGEMASVGASCKKAAEMAVSELNTAGGVQIAGERHGISLVFEDSAGKADLAVAAARKLIEQEKVLALIGPNSSTGAVPAAAVAEELQTLMITPWATAPKVTVEEATGNTRKWVFRACYTDLFETKVLAKFARHYIRAEKAAVLYDSTAEAPHSQAELFKKAFEEIGGSIVAMESYTGGEKDFGKQLARIKAAGPGVLFLPSYYGDVPLQLTQVKAAGLKVPVLGSDNWNTPELVKLGLVEGGDGVFFAAHYTHDAKTVVTGTFVESFKKAYVSEVPDDVAALTYDAVSLLTKAMSEAKTLDRSALRDAFAAISTYDGVTGRFAFTSGSGDPVKVAVMKQIRGPKTFFVTNMEP